MRLLLALTLLFPIFLNAQDTHFSGRYAVRSYTNPANISKFNGSEQASATYRRHWSSLGSDFPFQTFMATATKKWDQPEVGQVALDLRLMKDIAPGGSFTQDQAIIGANYKRILDQDYGYAKFISLGVAGGFGQNKANWDGLWFGNQFDFEQGSPNTAISSGEKINVLLNQKTYADLTIGLAYEVYSPHYSMNINVAAAHLTRPDISFAPGVEIVNDRKISANISLNVLAGEDLYFIFSPHYANQGVFHTISTKLGLVFMADRDYDINFGIAAVPNVVQNFEGLGFESLGFQVYFEKNQYRFDFSYDATLSKLSDFNSGRGGFEFSLIYTRRNEKYDSRSSFAKHNHIL